MNESDKTKFAGIMKALAINAGIDIGKDALKLYFSALKVFSIEQIEEASKKILFTWEFNRMPPLAEIVKVINNEPAIEDKATATAHKIISHLKLHGSTKYPNLYGDEVAMELMSHRWPYKTWASTVLESELKWWAKEFKDAYISYQKTDHINLLKPPEEIMKLVENIGNIE